MVKTYLSCIISVLQVSVKQETEGENEDLESVLMPNKIIKLKTESVASMEHESSMATSKEAKKSSDSTNFKKHVIHKDHAKKVVKSNKINNMGRKFDKTRAKENYEISTCSGNFVDQILNDLEKPEEDDNMSLLSRISRKKGTKIRPPL